MPLKTKLYWIQWILFSDYLSYSRIMTDTGGSWLINIDWLAKNDPVDIYNKLNRPCVFCIIHISGTLQRWPRQRPATATGTTAARLCGCSTPGRRDGRAGQHAGGGGGRDTDRPHSPGALYQVVVTTIYESPWRRHTVTNQGHRCLSAAPQRRSATGPAVDERRTL